jgi:hypothetical protein
VGSKEQSLHTHFSSASLNWHTCLAVEACIHAFCVRHSGSGAHLLSDAAAQQPRGPAHNPIACLTWHATCCEACAGLQPCVQRYVCDALVPERTCRQGAAAQQPRRPAHPAWDAAGLRLRRLRCACHASEPGPPGGCAAGGNGQQIRYTVPATLASRIGHPLAEADRFSLSTA